MDWPRVGGQLSGFEMCVKPSASIGGVSSEFKARVRT